MERFEEGLERYKQGNPGAYRAAAARFEEALRLDANYSQAALYAGRVYDALFEHERAARWFRRAIEIDPDFLEARASYGGMLLGTGNLDEAIRQFNAVTRREPRHALALYLCAQAYRMKGLYDESIESARQSIAVAPEHAESHFWLAERIRINDCTAIATTLWWFYCCEK